MTLTNYQTDWARQINPVIKIVKIPNGVSFEDKSSKILHFDLSHPVVLSVGALEKNKRHDLTIKAVAKIENAFLLMVGRGSEETNLRNLAKKYIPGRFTITSLPYKEMHSVYQIGDVFVFPTVPWESFGIATVEAMASGLPVVASDDPIRREIVGNAGIFVDPTDTTAFASAIQKALNTNWGDKPRNQAKKYDWDIIADQYEKLFKEIV